MNHSLEIVRKIRNTFEQGRLPSSNIPVQDLLDCVRLELESNHLSYTEEQSKAVMDTFEELCAAAMTINEDEGRMRLFLLGLELCLQTISEAVLSLAGKEYWQLIHEKDLPDPELEEVIDYVDQYKQIRLLPYAFVDEYLKRDCPVFYDEECGMCYVLHKEKRMYFPERMNEQQIKDYYNTILAEQDERSPHCYKKSGYEVKAGDVVVDCGGAEGFFALEYIDVISKAYIFDADDEWIRAMERTFRPYGNKVELYRRYVGDVDDDEKRISLDKVLQGKKVNFIKMDIEGYEKFALQGAVDLLSTAEDLRLAICAYHCKDDEIWITDFLSRYGMEVAHSNGYMCPDWINDGLLKAEVRRGVLFGRRKQQSEEQN